MLSCSKKGRRIKMHPGPTRDLDPIEVAAASAAAMGAVPHPFSFKKKDKGTGGKKRSHKKSIYSNYFINSFDNILTLPYVSVYEASNVFGYAHANSIYQEYKNDFDILNITPGAVVTENTQYLSSVMLSVKCDSFVQAVMKLIGNIQGNSCGCWQHELSLYLVAIFPFIKPFVLKDTGKLLANHYMQNYVE